MKNKTTTKKSLCSK